MLNEDYKDMLRILLDHEVRFLLVGAYAMGIHGYPRATGDMDIWVQASKENSRKIYESLGQFGAPLSGLTEETFCEEGKSTEDFPVWYAIEGKGYIVWISDARLFHEGGETNWIIKVSTSRNINRAGREEKEPSIESSLMKFDKLEVFES